ncbi:SusD/RagB family nutrient-binding outer membrane lipoprotein [Anditalea andensis]|uniref:SusD/RagB family lipoprotein n=1 Tax=Anditalea andensis TaxID=1048983 RepID=A0A074L356_9BACT|nr:SusD/RagB family nutrient-binding outer membrane lipoprotein [Anditalea andensis]KEO74313.1 hypothetical protein EL17_09290 [Anditalea andensis]
MKKNYILKFTFLLAAMGMVLSSCIKEDFDENYYDPESSVNANIPQLFSGLLYNHGKQSNNTIFPRYWNMFTFQAPMLGTYTQTNGYYNNPGLYEQAVAYTQTRWDYFYTAPVASFREMEKVYNSLETEDERQGYLLFIEAGKIFLYDQTAQMVDMWGDIPFHESGQLNATGGQIILPAYDNQEELYHFILDDLKRIADYLADVETIAFYKTQFDRADIINLGDLMHWRIYANSLRLRMAMRISYADENKARAVAVEILNSPDRYPVVTDQFNQIEIEARGEQLRSVVGVNGIREALQGEPAPGFMVNELLLPSGDPRLRVMFTTNNAGTYQGLPNNLSAAQQTEMVASGAISRIDSATYSHNDKFPGIIITAAEISLLKAEAAERWGLGSAAESYYNGIRQSIAYLYEINNRNDNADGTSFLPKAPPTNDEMAAFLTHPKIAYEGTKEEKLEKIGTQAWLNFGLIQAYHGWAELRRTGYPRMSFVTDNSSVQAPLPPSRLFYPESERLYNAANYQKVSGNDTPTAKVFWHVR